MPGRKQVLNKKQSLQYSTPALYRIEIRQQVGLFFFGRVLPVIPFQNYEIFVAGRLCFSDRPTLLFIIEYPATQWRVTHCRVRMQQHKLSCSVIILYHWLRLYNISSPALFFLNNLNFSYLPPFLSSALFYLFCF